MILGENMSLLSVSGWVVRDTAAVWRQSTTGAELHM